MSPLRSELKLKILFSLLNGEKKVTQLKDDVETRDTTILHILEEFSDLDLITRNQGFYRLTPLGLIEAEICRNYMLTFEVIDKFRSFWLSHNTSAIPPQLLLNIGELINSSLVRTEASELGIVHKTFLESIKESKKIKGISPIFHPDFITLFGQLLDQGCKIQLIVNREVLKKLLATTDIKSVKDCLVSESLVIYLNDNIKVALALTEHSFSLGLFLSSGTYDDNADLRSNSAMSIEWGEQLFQSILKNSRRLGMESFT
jgi:predicted transcriptional regulator